MKRMITLMIALLFVISSLVMAGDRVKNDVDWQSFNANLVKALKSDCEGLQVSAMVQYLNHADSLDINPAVLNVIGVYRDSKNLAAKRLALATLHKMDNNFAIGFLRRALRFEESPVLQNQIAHIIAARESGGTQQPVSDTMVVIR